MSRSSHGCQFGLDPPAIGRVPAPDRVVIISDWLTKVGGGVNTVIKDQIDYLTGRYQIPVDVVMEGGDYEPEGLVTFTTFPDAKGPDCVYDLVRRHVVEPAAQGLRIAAIIHNLLTIPYSPVLNQTLRRIIAEVASDPALAPRIQFIAWTHDVFDVPHEAVPGVTYVAISEERQQLLAEYLHEPPSRIAVVPNAVNLPRTLALSPAAIWLLRSFRLCDEDFVAFCPVRLAANKNLEGAIRIVAALNRLGQRTTLIVPGLTDDWQRPYYDQLHVLAGELGIPGKVIFLTDLSFQGRPLTVTDDVIRDLYKLASFLLFTSRDEGFGLPLIEAAAWRLPAVISPLPSLMRISRDTGTLVVDPDHESADEIARRIRDHMARNPAYRMQRRVFSRYNMAHQFAALGWRLPGPRPDPCRLGAQTSNYFFRRRIEDQFWEAVHNGLEAFEVFFDPQPEQHQGFRPEDLQGDIREWLRQNACQQDVTLSVYARCHVPEAGERRAHWTECLSFARDVGAALLVIDLPPPEAFRTGEFDPFVDDLHALLNLASAHHIPLAMENGSWTSAAGAWFHTPAGQLNHVVARLAETGRQVGVSFNAGRAHLQGDPVAYLNQIHEPVIHVKLSDNPGPGHAECHLRLGDGTLPLEPVLQALQRRGFRGLLILEYFYADLARERAQIEAALAATSPPADSTDSHPARQPTHAT